MVDETPALATENATVTPDENDPGWTYVKHDTKSLDCMSNDHAGCFVQRFCQCECHA